MKVTKALEDSLAALKAGVHPTMVVSALVIEGFTEDKAITIVRWGVMYLTNQLKSIEEPGVPLETE